MKIYNPFKAHIVQFENGAFAIRKFGLFCFKYLERNSKENHWLYKDEYYRFYYIPDNYEDCKKRYLEYIKPKPSKSKFIEQ